MSKFGTINFIILELKKKVERIATYIMQINIFYEV